MLRILHTADWHLGHSLHSIGREFEHGQFLDWLLDELDDQSIDALLVCGDVFDSIHPPASALAMFYRFLARARDRRPDLDVVVIGGNHDSAARLEVAAPLLRAFGVHVVGGVRRDLAGRLEVDRMIVPLRGGDGRVVAQCAAIPFLRISDLRPGDVAPDRDPLVEGVRAVYDDVFDVIGARRTPDQALIALGHMFAVGGEISELSERRVLGGNQHALPASIFPDDVSYVALGHLHKSQCVERRENVRYSGSPLPLSMGELHYKHQVVVAEFDGAQCTEIRPVLVPRAVELLRVPPVASDDVDVVCEALSALPERGSRAQHERPFLEVRVKLSQPEPNLRHRIETALEGRLPRLVKLTVDWTGHGRTLAEQSTPTRELSELAPESVFRSCYERAHDGEMPAELAREFDELLESVRAEESP